MKIVIIIFSLFIYSSFAVSANESIKNSHINANLQKTFNEFKQIMSRDLSSYFSKKYNSNVVVKYELLRKRPTQSGASFPRFYAWVEIKDSEKVIEAGAIRVSAINKTRVELTNYVSQKQIKEKPKSIELVFPLALCNDIRKRAGVQ